MAQRTPSQPACDTASAGPLPHLRFSTQSFAKGDRLDALNTFSRGLYAYSPRNADGTAPDLMLDAWSLCDIAAASVTYGPTQIEAPKRLESQFEEMVFLRWVKSGHLRVESDELQKEFGPGSIFLMQAHHKLQTLDDGASLCLRLPFDRVCYDPLHQGPIVGLQNTVWQVRVLVSALDALFETLPDTTTTDAPAIADHLGAMIRTVIGCDCCHEENLAALKSARTMAMRRFVLANLARPDLGLETLQTEFNASRATVYRAFDEVGGVARFVREQRLAAVMRDLQTTAPTRGAIRRCAEAHGFLDQASFLRMFRTYFGTRPSDVLGSTLAEGTFGAANGTGTSSLHMPSLASFWANQSALKR